MVRDGEDRQGTLTDDPVWDVVGDVASESGGVIRWVPLVTVPAELTAAVNEEKYDGGMIALVPSQDDIDRLVIEGYEPPEDLHLTLWFLADSTNDISSEALAAWQVICDDVASQTGPIATTAFGVGIWNPQGDTPAIVLNIADPNRELTGVRDVVSERSADAIGVPEWTDIEEMQHYPWVPHVCLAYSDDEDIMMIISGVAVTRVGPVTFDTLRLAVGGDNYDYRLTGSGS